MQVLNRACTGWVSGMQAGDMKTFGINAEYFIFELPCTTVAYKFP